MAAHGHVGPLIPIASELLARGHDVDWYTGEKVREKVQATGARHLPHVQARDLDADAFDAEFPERARKKGMARFRFDMREIFIAAVPGQVADLETYIEEARPGVIVAEPAMAGAAQVIEQRHGIPYATAGIGPLMMRSADTAPFGLGLQPPRSRLGRLRNRALDALIQRTLFAAIDRDYRAMCERMGIPYTPGGVFDAVTSPYLFLHPSVPSFEYPRSDLPPQVRFVGPLLPPVPAGFTPPTWWDELDERPIVLVTQGTVATDPEELLLPTLEGLRDEPVQVIGVTGGADPATLPAPPSNARVEAFVPFAALMPRLALMVTNGGYGGMHYALAHGVPLVVVGATEEKPEAVARVNWSGVGVGIRRQRARPEQLRAAVRRVLDDPRYRERAAAMRAELTGHGGAARAADLLEELALTAAPPRPGTADRR